MPTVIGQTRSAQLVNWLKVVQIAGDDGDISFYEAEIQYIPLVFWLHRWRREIVYNVIRLDNCKCHLVLYLMAEKRYF